MYSMELSLTDGREAITFTNDKYHAYNWFMNTACRQDVNTCKVSKIDNEGKKYSILRYKNHDDK